MKKLSAVLLLLVFLFQLNISAFAADTLRYSVDFAPNGIYYDGTDQSIRITGWAFDSSGTRVDCYYIIDSSSPVYTDPVVRNDVKNAFPECSQTDCGFDQHIPVSSIGAGEHTFKFYAKRGSDSKLLSQTQFEVRRIVKDCNTIPSGEYNADEVSSLNVCGWAFSSWGETTDCYYRIDELPAVLLEKKQRADVAAYYDICAQENCGFNSDIPISEFALGEHTLTLFALCGEKEAVIAQSQINIVSVSLDLKYSNDLYLSGDYNVDTTESVHVGGWAFDKNGNEIRCFYQIDDGEKTVLQKFTRNDVYNLFDECSQLDCGYDDYVPVSSLSKGAHTYRVYAVRGNVTKIIKESEFCIISTDGELRMAADFLPDGEYDLGTSPYALVQGWGFNTSAQSIKFYGSFDGGDEFHITSENRKDVFNAFDDCYTLSCGYKQSIFLGNLSAGSHTFKVRAVSGGKTDCRESSFSIIRPVYTVSFDTTGGSGNIPSLTKTYGKNAVLPSEIPVKPYYEFLGWSTLPDGGEKYAPGEEFRQNASAVLYAVWQRDTFEPAEDSGISVDLKNGLIYGIEPDNNDSLSVRNKFLNTNVSTDSAVTVTGTHISLSDSGESYLTAQAVILGDTDRDGLTDARDAVLAQCIESQLLPFADKAVMSAADCARDGYINSFDIDLMLGAGLMTDAVDQHCVTSRGYYDTDFDIAENSSAQQNSLVINSTDTGIEAETTGGTVCYGIDADFPDFNFFGIRYQSSGYIKGTLKYTVNGSDHSEDFFLEPCEEKQDFYSFTDGVFDNIRINHLISLEFKPIENDAADIQVYGFSLFNRAVPEKVTFIQNESVRIGVNLDWGGALSYYEDLDSCVQAVSDKGIIRIDSNASQRYNTETLSDSVNLINCHDAGRLVQQSYYGTTNYDMGFYNGHYVAYNPVQGGNMYNDSSKIVDVRADGDVLYIKCRPLDWAKEKEYITDSYMEATYTLCGDSLKTQCRFVDFSGYDPAQTGQELPAFYSAATLGRFVYYGGNAPWTDGELSEATGLDEYLYAHYPTFDSTENWGALTGEFSDSFSIGLYIPGVTLIAAGVYGAVTDQNANPDTSNPTSYLSGVRSMLFKSFEPIEYDFYISTGTVDEVRQTFKTIAQITAQQQNTN